MRRYRIFEPPGAERRSEDAVFLRDGFRPWALVLPSLWLLRHRLYLWAVAAFLAELVVKLAAPEGGVPLAAFLSILIGSAAALEGPSLRARRLVRRGWRETAAVWARDATDAELLYYGNETTEAREALPVMRASEGRGSPLRPGASLFDLRSA